MDIAKTLETFFSSTTLKLCQASYAKVKQRKYRCFKQQFNDKTEEERILSMVDDAKRLETIEQDFKRIKDENSSLFLANAKELDENILKNIGNNQYDFSASNSNSKNYGGDKELIKLRIFYFST